MLTLVLEPIRVDLVLSLLIVRFQNFWFILTNWLVDICFIIEEVGLIKVCKTAFKSLPHFLISL